MARKYKERHTELIDSLEAVMFPFQEGEFEAESFTDIGRQRVDEWLDRTLGAAEAATLRAHVEALRLPIITLGVAGSHVPGYNKAIDDVLALIPHTERR